MKIQYLKGWFGLGLLFVIVCALGIFTAEVLQILNIQSWPKIVGAFVAITARGFVLVAAIKVRGHGKIGAILAYVSTAVMFTLSAFYMYSAYYDSNPELHIVMQTGNISLIFIELFTGILSQDNPQIVSLTGQIETLRAELNYSRADFELSRNENQKIVSEKNKLFDELNLANTELAKLKLENNGSAKLISELKLEISKLGNQKPNEKFAFGLGTRAVYFDTAKVYNGKPMEGVEVAAGIDALMRRLERKGIDIKEIKIHQ